MEIGNKDKQKYFLVALEEAHKHSQGMKYFIIVMAEYLATPNVFIFPKFWLVNLMIFFLFLSKEAMFSLKQGTNLLAQCLNYYDLIDIEFVGSTFMWQKKCVACKLVS
ncbi:hypothetical protein CR513_22908, partial [Mucuna pruriens]